MWFFYAAEELTGGGRAQRKGIATEASDISFHAAVEIMIDVR